MARRRKSGELGDWRPPRGTRVNDLAQKLAEEIVIGQLPPGLRLEEMELAARFKVSRTPVREALQVLAAGGLVTRRPNRGAVVASLDGARLSAMFEVMAELEVVCVRLAAERMAPRERQALETMHRESSALVHAGDRDGFAVTNRAFHEAIYEGTHNPELVEVTVAARRRVAPFRRAQFNMLGRLAQSWAEHEAIVNALLAADAEAAARAMRAHLTVVQDNSKALVCRVTGQFVLTDAQPPDGTAQEDSAGGGHELEREGKP